MEPGLNIVVVAASTRYAGSTRIYAGLDELSQLAFRIEGAPQCLNRRDAAKQHWPRRSKPVVPACSARSIPGGSSPTRWAVSEKAVDVIRD